MLTAVKGYHVNSSVSERMTGMNPVWRMGMIRFGIWVHSWDLVLETDVSKASTEDRFPPLSDVRLKKHSRS